MAVTQSQFDALITDRLNQEGWDIKKGDVVEVLKAQAGIAHELIAKGETVPLDRIGLKILLNYKPKSPKHRAVVFGEEREVAAKPASVRLKARFLKSAKDVVPTGRALTRIFGTGEPAKPAAKPKAAARRAGKKR